MRREARNWRFIHGMRSTIMYNNNNFWTSKPFSLFSRILGERAFLLMRSFLSYFCARRNNLNRYFSAKRKGPTCIGYGCFLVFEKGKYGAEEKSKAVTYMHKVSGAITNFRNFFCTSTMRACFLRIRARRQSHSWLVRTVISITVITPVTNKLAGRKQPWTGAYPTLVFGTSWEGV